MIRVAAVLIGFAVAGCTAVTTPEPPTRVKAIEANLPPAKAFTSTRPRPPARSNANIAADFLSLHFALEGGATLPVFTRFEGPITVRLTGSPTPSMQRDLTRLLTRLQREAGIDIRQITDGQANITIEAVSQEQIQRILPQAACFVVPNASSFEEYRQDRRKRKSSWTALRSRERLGIFIPYDVSPQEKRDCLHEELAQALRAIVTITIILVASTAAFVPFALGSTRHIQPVDPTRSLTKRSVALLMHRPALWLHGLVVLCAYCGYKSIDNYGIFAVDVFGSTDVEASQLTTLTFWARPFAAIAAGLVSDRFNHFKSMATLFMLAAIGNLSLIFLVPPSMPWFGLAMVAVTTAAAMYGLRGIYFAVFDDLQIPRTLIGTAAGIISLIGFLPDVFFGTLTGFLIDHYPGRQGHQLVFGLVCFVSLLGLFTCLWNDSHLNRRKNSGLTSHDPKRCDHQPGS